MMFLLAPPDLMPPLPYPHPVITEVLYAVPTKVGDANRDGTRDSAGDEFIELINPHDRPINLKGYSVSDSGEGKARFKFTFPAVSLEPGQVVVVFNGSDAKMTGPVGDAKLAPTEGHPGFHGALVFNAKMPSSRASWANKSDYALLNAPNGSPLECVYWGDEKKPPANCGLCEEAPVVSRGSVQRVRIDPEAGEPDSSNAPALPAPATPATTSNAKPPAASPAKVTKPSTTDGPGGAAGATPSSGSKPPATSQRPVYVRKHEYPPPAERPAAKKLTFGPFFAHPGSPASLVGRTVGGEADETGILFSPGLYPLEAEHQSDPQGERPADGSGQPEAVSPQGPVPARSRDNSNQPPPRRNTGDPR